MLIFDAHLHVGAWGTWEMRGNRITPFPYEHGCYEEFKSNYLERYNPEFAVIVPHYLPDKVLSFQMNKTVLDFIKLNDRLLGGLWVNPSPKLIPLSNEVLSLYPQKGLKVIKMSPDAWDSELTPNPQTWSSETKAFFDRCIDLAKKENLVIHFHTGMRRSDPTHFEGFMNEYCGSEVAFQFVHMGNVPGGHFVFIPLFIKWLEKKYNVFCDVSWSRGFAPRWLIHELQERDLGFDRILFASDEPWGDFPSEVAKVQNLRIDEVSIRKILYDNAYKLYVGEKNNKQ